MASNRNIPPEDICEEIISKFDEDDSQVETLSLVSKSFLSITNRRKQTLKIFEPTVHFLPSLLNRFQNIKHLIVDYSFYHLGNSDQIQTLHQIAKTDLRLETLDVRGILPMEELERLPVAMLSGVKSLRIGVSSIVVGDDLVMIANSFPKLEELKFYYDKYRSSIPDRRESTMDFEEGIAVMGSMLEKSLKRIDLDDNSWVSDQVFIALCDKCRNLEKIIVKRCSGVTQIGIDYAVRTCSKLKTIRYWTCDYMNDNSYDVLNDISDVKLCLSEIDFAYTNVSNAMLGAIVKADLPLKSFTLNECTAFTFSGIESFLQKYNSLDYLALQGVGFLYDSSIRTLANKNSSLTKIRHVKLNLCEYLTYSTLTTLLKRCPLLETVEMEGTNLGRVKGFGVNKDVIRSQMRTLQLRNTRLNDESLEEISVACPNLETLNLNRCFKISSKGVSKVLRNCGGLKNLDISHCFEVHDLELDRNIRLEKLEASNTSLNDQALIDMSKSCPGLMFLDLRNSRRITYSGIMEVMDNCMKLKEINLHVFQNLSTSMLHSMVVRRPSLRKIVLPVPETYEEYIKSKFDINLFLTQYGCHLHQEGWFK